MTERANKFEGWCCNCRGKVFVGKGFCSKNANGKWQVRHGICPERAAAAPRNNDPKPNQYGGRCANCGVFVPERAGRIVKTAQGWKAAHLTPEACQEAQAQAPVEQPKPVVEFPVPVGYYAIPALQGTNDLDFFCVKAGKGKWEGRTFINRVIGGRVEFGGTPMTRDERDRAVAGILAYGVDAARMEYANKIGHCWHCNKLLTDDESRKYGVGPKCLKDLGGPAALAGLLREAA